MLLELNPEGACAIGAEIGVDFVSIMLADFGGKPIWRKRVPIDPGIGQPAHIKRAGDLIGNALKHAGKSDLRPLGIGVGVPGLVDVVEGEVVDPDHVSAAIKDLWRHGGFKSKDVSIGLSNQKVVVRLIDLPYMERAELQGAIQYQAQDYIPYPVDQAILDFQIIGDYMTPSDEHMMEVLLVAAPREIVANAVQAVEGARLKLAQVDVTAFALVRALLGTTPSWFNEEVESPGEALGIVHVSSGLTNIAVVERGIPRFTRVSSLAGNQFTQAVANVLNLTFDEAEELKNSAGLPAIDDHRRHRYENRPIHRHGNDPGAHARFGGYRAGPVHHRRK